MTNPTTKCARNTSNFNETSNLKLLVNFISVFEGVWVKFEKKRKSHFVLHIYRRADKNFQENWWPRRYILRPLLFLHPLSGGRRTRLTISYYCETSRLVYTHPLPGSNRGFVLQIWLSRWISFRVCKPEIRLGCPQSLRQSELHQLLIKQAFAE